MVRLLNHIRPAETSDLQRPAEWLDHFAERYRQYFPRVFAYVYGRVRDVHRAEDIVSEVFERAFRKADSLRNNEAFGTWLFTIARNVVTSQGRKLAREQTSADSEALDSVPSHTTVESQVLQQEEVAAIARLVRQLPQREQEIIALKFDAELSNQQIAEIVGLREGNVRIILFRSLRKLRDMVAAPPPSTRRSAEDI